MPYFWAPWVQERLDENYRRQAKREHDTEKDDDPINHPNHYTSHPSGVECIDITEHMGFNLGNTIKYVWRADLKDDAVSDLRKAIFYIERELTRRQKTPEPAPVRKQLDELAKQREAVPGRPEDGPYPASVSNLADEVIRWCDDMEPFASGLKEALANRLGSLASHHFHGGIEDL